MGEWTPETRARLEALFAKPFTSRDRDKVRVSDVFTALSEIDRLTARVEALEAGAEQMLTYEQAGGDGWWRGWETLKTALTPPGEEPA